MAWFESPSPLLGGLIFLWSRRPWQVQLIFSPGRFILHVDCHPALFWERLCLVALRMKTAQAFSLTTGTPGPSTSPVCCCSQPSAFQENPCLLFGSRQVVRHPTASFCSAWADAVPRRSSRCWRFVTTHPGFEFVLWRLSVPWCFSILAVLHVS